MQRQPQSHYSLEEYFSIEETSPLRHEYYRGEIFAMAGASRNHNRIARNLLAALTRPFGSDLRLRTPAGLHTYPDVLVICGTIEVTGDRLETVTNPTLIVEVLSSSTAEYDRGEKFLHYIAIPSLREYILIDQYAVFIEQFLPSSQGLWESTTTDEMEATLHLTSLGVDVPLAEIYARVEWPDVEQEDPGE
jgi:Uma2 family endonuclease